MKESLAFPVVCIVAERFDQQGEPHILVQRRTKSANKTNVDYPSIWELPQGRIRTGETILEAASRELSEETGLDMIGIDDFHNNQIEHILESSVDSFHPLICVFDLEHNYIGLGVIAQVTGTPHNTDEASEHRWISQREAEAILLDQKVFPLNAPIIKEYFRIRGTRYVFSNGY